MMKPAPNFIDLTGHIFGRLTVIRRAPKFSAGVAFWECQCACGKTVFVRSSSLRNQGAKSCGCLRFGARHSITHGMSKTPEWCAWRSMLDRCNTPSSTSYPRYGAVGIRVCRAWLKDFQAFYDHVGPRPSRHHSLDRIRSEGNYESGNVRWATISEQARNRRSVIKVVWKGEPRLLRDVAVEMGLGPDLVVERYRRKKDLQLALRPHRKSNCA